MCHPQIVAIVCVQVNQWWLDRAAHHYLCTKSRTLSTPLPPTQTESLWLRQIPTWHRPSNLHLHSVVLPHFQQSKTLDMVQSGGWPHEALETGRDVSAEYGLGPAYWTENLGPAYWTENLAWLGILKKIISGTVILGNLKETPVRWTGLSVALSVCCNAVFNQHGNLVPLWKIKSHSIPSFKKCTSSSSSVFPSYISGVHHFGWDFCVCGRFLVQPLK